MKKITIEATKDGPIYSPGELDAIASTDIHQTIDNEVLARALASPPFLLEKSSRVAQTSDSKTRMEPVANLNFRDVACPHRTPHMKPNTMYRGAKSGFLAEEMSKLGIEKIYDLRSKRECLQAPHPAPSLMSPVEIIWIDPENKAAVQGSEVFTAFSSDYLVNSYLKILQTHRAIFKQILLDLAALDNGKAILLHCTAGKDRTGVSSAMILSLAGCSHESIASEYALTRIGIEPSRARLVSALTDAYPDLSADDPRFLAMCGCEGKKMKEFLRIVDDLYGGFEGYIRTELDLEQRTIDTVKSRVQNSHVL